MHYFDLETQSKYSMNFNSVIPILVRYIVKTANNNRNVNVLKQFCSSGTADTVDVRTQSTDVKLGNYLKAWSRRM
jgi:hypothetical protein